MVKLIKSPEEHEKALEEVDRLMDLDPLPGTPEADRLDVLFALVEKYEKERFPMELPDPIEAIKFRMEEGGLKQADLIPYIGSRSKVSEVLSGKRPLSIQMIKNLHNKLGIPAEVLLMEKADTEKNVLAESSEDYQINRIDLNEYDVEDKEKLKKFLEKRKEWVAWFDPNKLDFISHQIHQLIQNDLLFRSLNELLRIKDPNKEGKETINQELWDFMCQGYVYFQFVGIRCLIDKGSDVISLRKLINKIKSDSRLITRENYVCYDGVNFNPGNNDEPVLCESRHRIFSGIAKKVSGKKKAEARNDIIDPLVFEKLEKELDKCEEAKKIVDQYIAHKQKSPSEKTLSSLTLDLVEECQKAIIKVALFIDGPLLGEYSFQPFSMPQYDFFKGLDAPWVIGNEMEKLQEYYYRRGDELNRIFPNDTLMASVGN